MPGVILIVEDEVDLVPALEYALRRDGFRTLAVSTGRDALTAVAENPEIELVLLDLVLPDISGADVCRVLKGKRARSPAVILMTARPDALSVSGAVGAEGCLIKPFRVHDLIQHVRAALPRGAASRGRAEAAAVFGETRRIAGQIPLVHT